MLIGELRAKNKLKENVAFETIAETGSPPLKYKNYLEEVKQSRITRDIVSMSVDYALKLDTQDHELVRMEAMKKETKARQQ